LINPEGRVRLGLPFFRSGLKITASHITLDLSGDAIEASLPTS
jgi:hypothetical protein